MQTATIAFDRFNELQDDACHERIRAAREKLGKDDFTITVMTEAATTVPLFK